jgi:hypothetical protein
VGIDSSQILKSLNFNIDAMKRILSLSLFCVYAVCAGTPAVAHALASPTAFDMPIPDPKSPHVPLAFDMPIPDPTSPHVPLAFDMPIPDPKSPHVPLAR